MKTRVECQAILGEDLVSYVERTLSNKGINKQTIERVLDYLALHEQTFPYFDIEDIAQNLCNNLKESINFNGMIESLKNLIKENAYGMATGKAIFINTKPLKLILPPKHYNVMLDALIRHELDHIATTRDMRIDKETYKKMIARNIKACSELFGINAVPEGRNEKEYIDKLADSKFRCFIIQDGKKKFLQADRIVLPRCGVRGTQSDLQVGHFMGSQALNEGITAYKMKMMDKSAGQGGLMCQSGYILGEEIAKHIAKTIGEEEFIARQIAGDFVGIAERYKTITGKNEKQMQKMFQVLNTNGYKSILDKILSQVNYSKNKQMDKNTQEKFDKITEQNTI